MVVLDNDMLSILRYIYKNNHLTYNDVCIKFRKVADIRSRLSKLKASGYISYGSTKHGGGKTRVKSIPIPESRISCTYSGNRSVQDHFLFTREYWVRSVFTPIAVSVIISLLVNGIVQLLQWIL